ncbi:MAG: DUF2442 domain-containing protein [Deltaproteobacteria bacterium]|nr:DUF2442 domain-containing protein [Deltaproteobacteria bacterium]
MHPRVRKVFPERNYQLRLQFVNGEERIFDMRPYLRYGVFQVLKDPKQFTAVQAVLGSIQWPGGQDLCPDTLYEESQPLSSRRRNKG